MVIKVYLKYFFMISFLVSSLASATDKQENLITKYYNDDFFRPVVFFNEVPEKLHTEALKYFHKNENFTNYTVPKGIKIQEVNFVSLANKIASSIGTKVRILHFGKNAPKKAIFENNSSIERRDQDDINYFVTYNSLYLTTNVSAVRRTLGELINYGLNFNALLKDINKTNN